ncbi:MAG: Flp pilus assembly protein CpaB, partial [Myxococcota bacterium]
GEAVHEDRFSPHEGFGISALVPPGFRAMSLDLTSADQVSGLVEPGDHVDILVSLFDAERAASTFPVLQNVLVLAVEAGGVDMPLGTSAPRSQLTVLTTPEDANRLTHALQVGHPRLVLRPEDDDGEIRPVYVGAPVEPSRPSSAELLRAETRARARAAFLDFVRNHRFSGEERATLERALSRHRR